MAIGIPSLDPNQLYLIDAIHLPLVLIDIGSGRVVHVNGQFEELLGKEKKQIVGCQFTEVFSPASRPRVDALVRLFSETPESPLLSENNLEIIRSSHRTIPVNVSASGVRHGQTTFIIASVHDLSAIEKLHLTRERTLAELARVSKLADIGVLAAGVAHELNNPLMIIHGYAENIELLLEAKNPPKHELRTQIGEILRATERMGRVISQMTRIARHDEGKFSLVDLNEVASEVVRFMGVDLRHNNITVEMAFSEPLYAQCDAGQVEQILINIISNAKHALRAVSGPKLIRISGKNTSVGARLEISNNGPEIPAQVRERIMTPFFTTKEVGQGSGLGLAISYGIMKAHGGDISFTSTPYETTFHLQFPRLDKEVAKPILESRDSIDVLIVDDEAATLEILGLKLKSFGFNVYKSASAADALEVLRGKPSIKTIFTDIRMPGVDGLGLVRTVRQLISPMPLIFVLTGYSVSEAMKEELLELGVRAVLTKPLNHALFSQAVAQIRLANAKSAA